MITETNKTGSTLEPLNFFKAIDDALKLSEHFYTEHLGLETAEFENLTSREVRAIVSEHCYDEAARYGVMFDIFVKNLYIESGSLYLGGTARLPEGSSIIGVPSHFPSLWSGDGDELSGSVNAELASRFRSMVEDLLKKTFILGRRELVRYFDKVWSGYLVALKSEGLVANGKCWVVVLQILAEGDIDTLRFVGAYAGEFLRCPDNRTISDIPLNKDLRRYFDYVGRTNDELVMI